jgi:AcrR family transcriptional regulator
MLVFMVDAVNYRLNPRFVCCRSADPMTLRAPSRSKPLAIDVAPMPSRSPRAPRAGTADSLDGHGASVRERCVAEAHRHIAEHGLETLSLREVARRIGVSHQAPYKHFPSREHLIAEVIGRCFRRLAQSLDQLPDTLNPHARLHAIGLAYLRFANDNPVEYRLMFGTPWPKSADHPALIADARSALERLREALRDMPGGDDPETVDRQAMFIWSTLHGYVTIRASGVMPHLALAQSVAQDEGIGMLALIGTGLDGVTRPRQDVSLTRTGQRADAAVTGPSSRRRSSTPRR